MRCHSLIRALWERIMHRSIRQRSMAEGSSRTLSSSKDHYIEKAESSTERVDKRKSGSPGIAARVTELSLRAVRRGDV